MNVKEVKVTGTVPPFFGQGRIQGMDVGDGSMSDAVAAKMFRWFGMPLTELRIEFDTYNFLGKNRYPFKITGESSAAIWWLNDLLYHMVKHGAIIETAKARDLEDPSSGGWFQLQPKKYNRRKLIAR
jgi:hypothetical protein